MIVHCNCAKYSHEVENVAWLIYKLDTGSRFANCLGKGSPMVLNKQVDCQFFCVVSILNRNLDGLVAESRFPV